MIDWDWKKNIRNILEIKWYAILFQFVQDVIWQLSVKQQLSTTGRKKWVTMQLKNYTDVCRQIYQKAATRKRMKYKNFVITTI